MFFFFFDKDEEVVKMSTDIQNDYIYKTEQLNIEDFLQSNSIEEENIKTQIIAQIEEAKHNQIEYENSGEIDDDSENEIITPYDPEKIKSRPMQLSLEQLYNMVTGYSGTEEPEIDLKPDFQRNYVWKGKQKSALIESLLLRIPIPTIYLNETEEGKFIVADGVQRIQTIISFMGNDFKLSNMEYLTQFEGSFYKRESYSYLHNKVISKDNVLEPQYVRKFRGYQLTCHVIEATTPNQVKIDLFKRLNTGGTKLSHQEVRNAVMSPVFREQLKEIAEMTIYKKMITDKVNINRHVHFELILRMFAFYYYFKSEEEKSKYKGNTQRYLDEYVERINISATKTVNNDIIEELAKRLEILNFILSENAFRKISKNGVEWKRTSINALLLVVELFSIDVNKQYEQINANEYEKFLQSLSPYIDSATNNQRNIDKSFELMKGFISNYEKN